MGRDQIEMGFGIREVLSAASLLPLAREAVELVPLDLCKGGVGVQDLEMCSSSEAGSYLRLIDVCTTQISA